MGKILAAAACGLAALAGCGRRERPAGEGIAWLRSMPEALQEAGESRRPIMAVFLSDRCAWCGKLEKETLSDAGVRDLAGDFVAVRVDAGRDPSASRAYGIPALPTVVFLDPAGKAVHRVVGFKPPVAFLAEMRKGLASAR